MPSSGHKSRLRDCYCEIPDGINPITLYPTQDLSTNVHLVVTSVTAKHEVVSLITDKILGFCIWNFSGRLDESHVDINELAVIRYMELVKGLFMGTIP